MIKADTKELEKHTKRLLEINAKAVPKAVRNALNSAAFDVKKNTLLSETGSKFTLRQQNFFKAFSKVDPAKSEKIAYMKATIGMVESGLKGNNNKAVKNLEAQETGGQITNRAFIPLAAARTGNSFNKLVKAKFRLSGIKKIVNTKEFTKGSKKYKFMRAVHRARTGGFVLAGRTLYFVNNSNSKKPKTTAIYSYKKNRKFKVKASKFMEAAGTQSAGKIESFYIQNAQREINKLK